MTTFLFCAVVVSGMAIISRSQGSFDRRNRFVLTAGLALGYGATLVPTYFNGIFTYTGNNSALRGFLDAITLVMETGFAVCAIACMILNLILPMELEEDIDATNATFMRRRSQHQGRAEEDLAKQSSGRDDGDEISKAADSGEQQQQNAEKSDKQV